MSLNALRRCLRILLLMAAACGVPGTAFAQTYNSCTVATASADLGSVSSLVMAQQSRESAGGSGIGCSSLSLLSPSYIKVRVESSTFTLVGGPSNQSIPFALSATSGGAALAVGNEVDFSSANLLTLFAGPGGTLPLYFRAAATPALRAGTYTGNVNLRWYFSICSVGLLGVCSFSNSPGATRNLLGALTNWGSGVAVTVGVTLHVANDCAINAPALDFGAAPLVGSFSAVTRTIHIRCSAGTAYSVGLGNGNHFAAGRRRMRRGASADYLRYEIYRSASSGDRWGDQPGERRSSATADGNPDVYDGTVQQAFTYRAVVDPSQATPAAGVYTDNVVLEVQF